MLGERPTIAVVVLSYNRPRYLARALESLAAQSCPPSEVLVVDNRSPASEEIAGIMRRFPAFRLLALDTNTGFTGGMNRGISAIGGDYVYLTEDDMILAPDCMAQLMAYAEQDPTMGLLTGLIIDADGNRIVAAGGRVELKGVYRLEALGAGELDAGQFSAPFDVSYISGAMTFARRDTLERLGRFRDDFFMYAEDVELCLRARRAGVRITVVPAARARHQRVQSDKVPDEIQFHKLKNFLALHLLHSPGWRLPEFFGRYVVLWSIRPSSRGQRRLMTHALAWMTRNLPRLLRDRWRAA